MERTSKDGLTTPPARNSTYFLFQSKGSELPRAGGSAALSHVDCVDRGRGGSGPTYHLFFSPCWQLFFIACIVVSCLSPVSALFGLEL